MKGFGPLSIVVALSFSACSTLPLSTIKGKSWVLVTAPRPITIVLAYPDVDRQTAASSIEAELARLAPLLFIENGLQLAEGDGVVSDGTSCIAEIHAVEREYTAGWKTRRSATMEIVLRRIRDSGDGTAELVAASRAEAHGSMSLTSSRDLYRLLKTSVRKLAKRLEASGKR